MRMAWVTHPPLSCCLPVKLSWDSLYCRSANKCHKSCQPAVLLHNVFQIPRPCLREMVFVEETGLVQANTLGGGGVVPF